MSLISVAEAAERLRVSPRRVQKRIEDGSLPAVRIGHQWAIDPERLAHEPARSSRPLSPRMAWGLLHQLSGDLPNVSSAERVRLRAYAERIRQADDPSPLIRSWLSQRAARHEYRVATADFNDARSDARLLLSGVSAPRSGIVAQSIAEGYVAERDLAAFIDDYFLVRADEQPGNVILHIVEQRPAVISSPLLAADLSEHSGPREHARVGEIVRLLEES